MTFKYQKYLNVEKLSKNAINKTIKNIYVMKNRVSEKKNTNYKYADTFFISRWKAMEN